MPAVFLKGNLDYMWESPEKSKERKGTNKEDNSEIISPLLKNNSRKEGKTFAKTFFMIVVKETRNERVPGTLLSSSWDPWGPGGM